MVGAQGPEEKKGKDDDDHLHHDDGEDHNFDEGKLA